MGLLEVVGVLNAESGVHSRLLLAVENGSS
jgi:hypothetical protein